MQAGDLVDIFVGSAASADSKAPAKESMVEQLLDTQVLATEISFITLQLFVS